MLAQNISVTPQVFLEAGALQKLPELLQQINPKSILLVLDDVAYQSSTAQEQVEGIWAKYRVTRLTGFAPNPKLEDIQRGLALCRTNPPDLVCALGGGTAIDLGKLIGTLSMQAAAPEELIRGETPITHAGIPLIAIPTTAGTGSEATHFAVAYIGNDKYSVAHPSMLPRWSLIDPCLTFSLPPKLTAATGLDALCQAIESIWAVGATEASIADASHALLTARANLSTAVNAPTPAARLAMAEASHFAGRAINVSKTTASHALSYRLTSHYGIPHGIAVAMTISSMLAYNSKVVTQDCQDPRGANDVLTRIELIVKLLGGSNVANACGLLDQLIADCGCPTSLAAFGISSDIEIGNLIASVNAERMSNNPRRLSAAALKPLLQAACPTTAPSDQYPSAPHFRTVKTTAAS